MQTKEIQLYIEQTKALQTKDDADKAVDYLVTVARLIKQKKAICDEQQAPLKKALADHRKLTADFKKETADLEQAKLALKDLLTGYEADQRMAAMLALPEPTDERSQDAREFALKDAQLQNRAIQWRMTAEPKVVDWRRVPTKFLKLDVKAAKEAYKILGEVEGLEFEEILDCSVYEGKGF